MIEEFEKRRNLERDDEKSVDRRTTVYKGEDD